MWFERTCLVFVFVIVAFRTSESRALEKTKITKLLEIFQDEVQIIPNRNKCSGLPKSVLTEVLGSAFNSRYMSIEEPEYEMIEVTDDSYAYRTANKRHSKAYRPFYVDDTYVQEISDKPAWEVKHFFELEDSRFKRSPILESKSDEKVDIDRDKRGTSRRSYVKQTKDDRPWECEAMIKWIDLGSEYFPRFLRTVECTKHDCWYGHYTCKPRSFTVKILRRRSGKCVPANGIQNIGTAGLPDDLKELWVWEERAVNFCCDCSAR